MTHITQGPAGHDLVFKRRNRYGGVSASWRCSCGVKLRRTANANDAGVRWVGVDAQAAYVAHLVEVSS